MALGKVRWPSARLSSRTESAVELQIRMEELETLENLVDTVQMSIAHAVSEALNPER